MAGRTHFPVISPESMYCWIFGRCRAAPVYEIQLPGYLCPFQDCGFEIVGVADTAAELRGFMDKYAMPWTASPTA